MILALALTACDSSPQDPASALETLSGPAVERSHDPELVVLGESVYREHCAQCHGDRGQGDPNWRQRDAEGMFPPPPLNGTGHAWHHSKQWLKQMILNGSAPGKGKMPGWRGQLSDREIDAVIEWFQSRWPNPVYAAWYQNQQRNRGLR
ncbi:hypothetical protein Tel_03635 [Candidatus Tenderia electrophaga]|jgi:mono/diheme cytochrome c family protein|uniref:Cytochrome c domain-containing protein n=1 Tax=Candidatus Tenderia electrophaga TaxID=1748243 RepID=A0A0S2TAV8_9GAMM|nr:hypothetical protein Tel_03635 [Candidatus Tenderia electrophaga]